MANSSLSKYVVKSEDIPSTNFDMNNANITFYKQFNFIICQFYLTTTTYTNKVDHTVVYDGKIPSAFRPVSAVKQYVSNRFNPVTNGIITINPNGGMKLAMGTANTSMTINGSIMYPANVTDPLEEIYYFILSVPSIVQNGNTYTASVLVKNSENTPLESKTVTFKLNGDEIGTSQTDSNGIASTTFTASGSGTSIIVAESEQSRSELNILDCLCYDGGVTGDKSNDWTRGSAIDQNIQVDSTGTTLSITSATTTSGFLISTKALTGDFEATVYAEPYGNSGGSDRTRFFITDGSTRRYVAVGSNGYIKLIRQGGSTNAFTSSDGETWTTASMTGNDLSGTVYIGIGMYNNTSTTKTMKYKDLRVYPIMGE